MSSRCSRSAWSNLAISFPSATVDHSRLRKKVLATRISRYQLPAPSLNCLALAFPFSFTILISSTNPNPSKTNITAHRGSSYGSPRKVRKLRVGVHTRNLQRKGVVLYRRWIRNMTMTCDTVSSLPPSITHAPVPQILNTVLNGFLWLRSRNVEKMLHPLEESS